MNVESGFQKEKYLEKEKGEQWDAVDQAIDTLFNATVAQINAATGDTEKALLEKRREILFQLKTATAKRDGTGFNLALIDGIGEHALEYPEFDTLKGLLNQIPSEAASSAAASVESSPAPAEAAPSAPLLPAATPAPAVSPEPEDHIIASKPSAPPDNEEDQYLPIARETPGAAPAVPDTAATLTPEGGATPQEATGESAERENEIRNLAYRLFPDAEKTPLDEFQPPEKVKEMAAAFLDRRAQLLETIKKEDTARRKEKKGQYPGPEMRKASFELKAAENAYQIAMRKLNLTVADELLEARKKERKARAAERLLETLPETDAGKTAKTDDETLREKIYGRLTGVTAAPPLDLVFPEKISQAAQRVIKTFREHKKVKESMDKMKPRGEITNEKAKQLAANAEEQYKKAQNELDAAVKAELFAQKKNEQTEHELEYKRISVDVIRKSVTELDQEFEQLKKEKLLEGTEPHEKAWYAKTVEWYGRLPKPAKLMISALVAGGVGTAVAFTLPVMPILLPAATAATAAKFGTVGFFGYKTARGLLGGGLAAGLRGFFEKGTKKRHERKAEKVRGRQTEAAAQEVEALTKDAGNWLENEQKKMAIMNAMVKDAEANRKQFERLGKKQKWWGRGRTLAAGLIGGASGAVAMDMFVLPRIAQGMGLDMGKTRASRDAAGLPGREIPYIKEVGPDAPASPSTGSPDPLRSGKLSPDGSPPTPDGEPSAGKADTVPKGYFPYGLPRSPEAEIPYGEGKPPSGGAEALQKFAASEPLEVKTHGPEGALRDFLRQNLDIARQLGVDSSNATELGKKVHRIFLSSADRLLAEDEGLVGGIKDRLLKGGYTVDRQGMLEMMMRLKKGSSVQLELDPNSPEGARLNLAPMEMPKGKVGIEALPLKKPKMQLPEVGEQEAVITVPIQSEKPPTSLAPEDIIKPSPFLQENISRFFEPSGKIWGRMKDITVQQFLDEIPSSQSDAFGKFENSGSLRLNFGGEIRTVDIYAWEDIEKLVKLGETLRDAKLGNIKTMTLEQTLAAIKPKGFVEAPAPIPPEIPQPEALPNVRPLPPQPPESIAIAPDEDTITTIPIKGEEALPSGAKPAGEYLANLLYDRPHMQLRTKVYEIAELVKTGMIKGEDFAAFYAQQIGAEKLSTEMVLKIEKSFNNINLGTPQERMNGVRAMQDMLRSLPRTPK